MGVGTVTSRSLLGLEGGGGSTSFRGFGADPTTTSSDPSSDLKVRVDYIPRRVGVPRVTSDHSSGLLYSNVEVWSHESLSNPVTQEWGWVVITLHGGWGPIFTSGSPLDPEVGWTVIAPRQRLGGGGHTILSCRRLWTSKPILELRGSYDGLYRSSGSF